MISLDEKKELSVKAILFDYKQKVEALLEKNRLAFGPQNKLFDACSYAVSNGGKRLRPMITLMMGKALGKENDVEFAAIANEYFHTASLLADDLPCMDNSDLRRDKPSTHKIYGEDVAILASYALISEGYYCLFKNVSFLKMKKNYEDSFCDQVGLLAIENISKNTGALGATGGQFLDMYPEEKSVSFVKDVILKKTVALFEISFVLGWLFGGGDLEKLPLIQKLAFYFGEAFQIADDFEDIEEDKKLSGGANLVLLIGKEAAADVFLNDLSQFEILLDQLGESIDPLEFKILSGFLKKQTELMF